MFRNTVYCTNSKRSNNYLSDVHLQTVWQICVCFCSQICQRPLKDCGASSLQSTVTTILLDDCLPFLGSQCWRTTDDHATAMFWISQLICVDISICFETQFNHPSTTAIKGKINQKNKILL